MKKAISMAKLLKKSTSQDEPKFEEKVNVWRNKENLNVEKAASVIQSRKSDIFCRIRNLMCLTFFKTTAPTPFVKIVGVLNWSRRRSRL